MSRRNLLVAVGAVAAVALAVGGVVWYQSRTRPPTYSLDQITAAVRQHDYDRFARYVDVEGVVSLAMDDLRSVSESTEAATNGFAWATTQMLKPRLEESVEEAVKRYVETGVLGSLAGDTASVRVSDYTPPRPDDQTPAQGWGSLFAVWTRSADRVRYVRPRGAQAYVGLNVPIACRDTSLVLEVRMREKDGRWQVAALSNVKQFVTSRADLIPDTLVTLHAELSASRRTWHEARDRRTSLRDRLASLSDRMRDMDAASGRYKVLYEQFSELEPRVQRARGRADRRRTAYQQLKEQTDRVSDSIWAAACQ